MGKKKKTLNNRIRLTVIKKRAQKKKNNTEPNASSYVTAYSSFLADRNFRRSRRLHFNELLLIVTYTMYTRNDNMLQLNVPPYYETTVKGLMEKRTIFMYATNAYLIGLNYLERFDKYDKLRSLKIFN